MSKLAVRTAIRDAIAEEMRINPNIFLIGEEVGEYEGAYKVSQGLLAEFGEKRIVDTPITEAGFTGLAIGAAMSGLNPIVEFMTWNFAFQAIDQIINSAAKTNYMSGGLVNVPIVFRGPNGSALQVAAQHSHDLSSIFSNIPGLKVVCPSNPYDAKGLLIQSIRDNDPVIFCEHKSLYDMEGEVSQESYVIPFAEANVLRDGDDVSIVTYGMMVGKAIAAADILATEGVECEVIDLRTLSPIDMETVIESVENTGRLVVVDEANPRCSIATDVSAQVAQQAFKSLKAQIEMVTAPHTPVPFTTTLENLYIPSAEQIVFAVRKTLN